MVNLFTLKILILKSSHKSYIENKIKKININKKIGEGSYGIIYLIDNNHVIKIFKQSTIDNTKLNESNYLIPIKNENRELMFYFKYIDDKKENNYIINLFSIGIIKDKIIDNNILDLNSYFIILPLCIPFYKKYNILNVPLIYKQHGIFFTLKIMKRLVEISLFFEKKYNYINLDFKLNNFMFLDKKDDIDNLVMLDFSIIKKKTKTKYNIDNNYYIWPNSNNVLVENIPSYSTCINGLELLFGHNSIRNNNKINYYLNIIKKNKQLYNIFYNGLILKINTDTFMKLLS